MGAFQAFADATAKALRRGDTDAMSLGHPRSGGVPRAWIDADQKTISCAKGATIEGAGHQPEIAREYEFSRAVNECLS